MEGCLFVDNHSSMWGSGVHIEVRSSFTIVNCTFDRNETTYNSGGAITLRADSRVEIINTLITNTTHGKAINFLELNPSTIITHTNLFNNESGDWIDDIIDLENENGNLSVDPLYVNSSGLDYHLSEGSPCIDAGSADVNPDPNGTPSDIGAFYFDQSSGIADEEKIIFPEGIKINGNYPNPFNSRTTLLYSVGTAGSVKMVVYDVLGRVVDQVSLGFHQVGRHYLSWNPENLPSGNYILHLSSGNNEAVRMVNFIK